MISIMTIRLARIRSGLSQSQLSRTSHVHASDISRIESGKLKPSCEQLERLAEALEWKEPIHCLLETIKIEIPGVSE